MSKKIIAQNKKAYHDYFIEDTLECGIVLTGTEIKSLRDGKCSIKEAWCNIVNGELFVNGMHIAKYENGNIFNHEELRVRKLLAHRREINKLIGIVAKKGYTLVPIEVYLNERGKAKVLLGVCRGKHNYDKRKVLKEKAVKRDIERALVDRGYV